MINFNKAGFVTSYGLLSQIPPSERLEIAFAGRSNVGKSSMINKLFNRKGLARVSSVPGKTATINFYQTGDEVYFVDLIDFLIESEIPFLIVLTKADKLSKNQQAVRLEALQTELPYADQITMLPFSSETGMGVEELREILDEVAQPDDVE